MIIFFIFFWGGGGYCTQVYFFDIFHLLAPVWIYKKNVVFLAYPEDTIPGGWRVSDWLIIELTQSS